MLPNCPPLWKTSLLRELVQSRITSRHSLISQGCPTEPFRQTFMPPAIALFNGSSLHVQNHTQVTRALTQPPFINHDVQPIHYLPSIFIRQLWPNMYHLYLFLISFLEGGWHLFWESFLLSGWTTPIQISMKLYLISKRSILTIGKTQA